MDLALLFETYCTNVSSAMLDVLAKDLQLDPIYIDKLGVGFCPRYQSWAFAERDEKGKIIGIVYRGIDGKKFMETGSNRGLAYYLNQNYERGEKRYAPGKHNWTRTTKDRPCPICQRIKYCMVSSESPGNPAAVLCTKVRDGSVKPIPGAAGFLHILDQARSMANTTRGLLPVSEYPVIVVEGHSDVIAAMEMGFVAVGRPSAQGKMDLLAKVCAGRNIIVVGENDSGAGKEGMEAAFQTLKSVCPKVNKILPLEGFKDLRDWKNRGELKLETLLKYVDQHSDTEIDPDILPSDVAADIAKVYLKNKYNLIDQCMLRNWKGQWVEYNGNKYIQLLIERVRGDVYRFLEDKKYPRTDAKGGITITPYKPTRSKVSDILDACCQWCPIGEDPPVWLDDKENFDPVDLIVFENGILECNHNILKPPTPKYFSFTALPYPWEKAKKPEVWLNFLNDVFNKDPERIRLLQQWFGYNLVPDMGLERLMVFVGRPRSGKGTVISALTAMLGSEQVASISFAEICGPFGLQPLIGKLAALLSDARISRRVDAGQALERILAITGRDPVSINRKCLAALPNIQLKCRFTIAVNVLPSLPDHAQALESRLALLHFPNSYVGREDRSLKRKIQAEAQGICMWALDGLRDLREEKDLIIPTSSEPIINEFRAVTTPASSFINECCEIGNGTADVNDLYEAWRGWCGIHGLHPGFQAQFCQKLMCVLPDISMDVSTRQDRSVPIYNGLRIRAWVYKDFLGKP